MLAVRTDTAHRITWTLELPGSVIAPEQPQLLPAENMQVSMEHRPPSIFASVEHQPIPTLRDPRKTRNRSPGSDNLGQNRRRGGSQRKRVLMMLNRHHQHMHLSLRVNVPNSQGPRRPMHHGSRNLPSNDLAKQAVSHNTHDPRPYRSPTRTPLYAELKVQQPSLSQQAAAEIFVIGRIPTNRLRGPKPSQCKRKKAYPKPKTQGMNQRAENQRSNQETTKRTKVTTAMGGPGGEAPPAGGLGAWPPKGKAAPPCKRSPRAGRAQGELRRGEVWGSLHRDAACAGPRGEVSGGSTQVPHHDPVKQEFEYGT